MSTPDSGIEAAAVTPADRQKTPRELEMEAGQRCIARLAGPQTDGAAPSDIKPSAKFAHLPPESLAEGIKRSPAPKIASQVAVRAPNVARNSTPAPKQGPPAPQSVDQGQARPADHAVIPSSRPIELTLITQSDGPCTKRISLVDGQVVSDGSACAILDGKASRLPIGNISVQTGRTPLQVLAAVIAKMNDRHALCLGRLTEGISDRTTVVTERRRKENSQPHVISRTQQFFQFKNAEPALMLVDFDRKGVPQEVVDRINRSGGAWNALIGAIPSLGAAGRISRASTSAGVYNAETGERYAGSGGEHHYLLVADGSDIPRALNDLHDRAWLSGLGWFMVGGAGQLLDRSIVDRSVGSPERLVFEGAPVMVSPLAQDRESRLPLVTEGIAIDTQAVIPSLTDAERDIVKSLKDLARKQLRGEADRVREQSDRSLAKDISESAGIHFETALRQVRARHDGALLPSILLEFDDSDLGTVTVGHLLDNPDRFVGETLADPLEGAAYGRCKAKVMRGDDGEIFLHSFAHGGAIYHLVLDAARLKKEIEAAPPQSAWDVLVASLLRARP